MSDPVQPFLRQQGILFVDGGLATELEARGYDLGGGLWSARLLRDDPEAIKKLHRDYLEAGADCIISASYQGTVAGFVRHGLSEEAAEALLRRSVLLARSARDEFWADPANRVGRLCPLVAASIGPYGAYLADGSEYSGDYGLERDELTAFHRERWHILWQSGPDLLACETIPSAMEAQALRRLLRETPGCFAWFSFSCRDEIHLNDGTPLADVVAALDDEPQVVAIGVNCTAPRFIPGLVRAARAATTKPIIVYPNSGERYDVETRSWHGESRPSDFAAASSEWRAAGAGLLGGCCRTGPEHIRLLRFTHNPATYRQKDMQ
jgi:homocysteine S-methyltransferase